MHIWFCIVFRIQIRRVRVCVSIAKRNNIVVPFCATINIIIIIIVFLTF